MDTPIEKEIENLEKRLKKAKSHNPEVVFKCPKCKTEYSQLMNYRELRMCGKCFTEIKTREMQEHVEKIIGGTIIDVKVGKIDTFSPKSVEPEIVEIKIKTKNGEILTLKKPKEVVYLF